MKDDIVKLPCGMFALIRVVPLHRRKPGSRAAYSRPTHWLAQAGEAIALGRTRREAIDRLRQHIA